MRLDKQKNVAILLMSRHTKDIKHMADQEEVTEQLRSCGRPHKPYRNCTCILCDKRRQYVRDWARKRYRNNDIHRMKRLQIGKKDYYKNQLAILMWLQLLRIIKKEGQEEL